MVECGEIGTLGHGGNVKWYSLCENSMEIPQKKLNTTKAKQVIPHLDILIYPPKLKAQTETDTNNYVFGSISHNSQKVEISQVFTDR